MTTDTDLYQRIEKRLAARNEDLDTPIELTPVPRSGPLKPQVAFGQVQLRDALAIAAMPLVSWYGDAAKTSPAKCWQIADDMLAARSAT
jgi:hypothetical protein